MNTNPDRAAIHADDAEQLRSDLYDDLNAFARETQIPGLQHAQIRDELAVFLTERLLRRLAAEAQGAAEYSRALATPPSGEAAAYIRERLAAEAPTTTKPETESCAHCGKTIRRITGTLTEWWVHEPGGHTICFPEQAASSPRATPKPGAGVGQDGAQPCPHIGDTWFDRSICPPPCNAMHDRCTDCGTALGGCPLTDGEA